MPNDFSLHARNTFQLYGVSWNSTYSQSSACDIPSWDQELGQEVLRQYGVNHVLVAESEAWGVLPDDL